MWPGRKCRMEIRNGICGVCKIRRGFPSAFGLVVTHPIHQIKKFAASKFGVEDRMDLKLRKAIHLDRQGDLHDTTREGVWHMQLQQADMEDRMDMHGGWQHEAIG